MTMPDQCEKPRRRLLRLRDYDYTRPGAYFVTVCTRRRACLFGHIADGMMRPNTLGAIVETCWLTLPHHYPHARLDAFVVMPNHAHGILFLDDDAIARRATSKRHGLSEIMRAFKTFSSRRVNALSNGSGARVWQRGYYEHIIRNETSLRRLRNYIETNPLRWDLDRENPGNGRTGRP